MDAILLIVLYAVSVLPPQESSYTAREREFRFEKSLRDAEENAELREMDRDIAAQSLEKRLTLPPPDPYMNSPVCKETGAIMYGFLSQGAIKDYLRYSKKFREVCFKPRR